MKRLHLSSTTVSFCFIRAACLILLGKYTYTYVHIHTHTHAIVNRWDKHGTATRWLAIVARYRDRHETICTLTDTIALHFQKCESLRCAIPGKGCVSTMEPVADGTRCGENRVNYCLEVSEGKLAEYPRLWSFIFARLANGNCQRGQKGFRSNWRKWFALFVQSRRYINNFFFFFLEMRLLSHLIKLFILDKKKWLHFFKI